MKKVIRVECDGLEWLYVPDVTYCVYDEHMERHLQLLVPYRQEWKEDERYPLVLFIPASNEPSSRACADIWRLPRGLNTPPLGAFQV